MVALAELLDPCQSRLPQAYRPAEPVFVHLAQPMRRALILAIGYDEVPESYLKVAYGASWGTVQPDLRALVSAGYIVIRDINGRAHFSLDLSMFPRQMAASLFAREARQVA